MLNYLYLDYGGRARHRAELKYSLISLQAELDPDRARIVVLRTRRNSIAAGRSG